MFGGWGCVDMWCCQEPEGYRGAVVATLEPGLKDALGRKRTYKEHRDFLQSFQNYREVRKRSYVAEGEEG